MPKQAPRPIDPDVKVPAAVARHAAAAEAFYNQDDPPADGSNPNPESQGAGEGQNQAPAPSDPPASPQETPPNNNEPPREPQRENQPPNWEHMYNSMRGRFDISERRNRELEGRLSNLEQTLATINQRPPEVPREQQAASLITPEERETYGEDFLSVVEKVAAGRATQLEQKLMTEVQNLKKQLQGVGGQVALSAREKVHATLDQQYPSWRDLNHDEGFNSWLDLRDPFSGVIRRDMLKAAYEQNNAPRVLAFFKGFRSEEATVSPAGGQPGQNGNGAAAPKPQKTPLSNLAAPGRAKTAAGTTAPAEKPFIRTSDITAFFADAAAGKYRGREKEKEQFERELFEAQQEGRIIHG